MKLSWENEVNSHWSSFILQDSWTCPWIWWGIPVLHCKLIDKLFNKNIFFGSSSWVVTLFFGFFLFFLFLILQQFIHFLIQILFRTCWTAVRGVVGRISFIIHSTVIAAKITSYDFQPTLTQYACFPDERTKQCPSWNPCQLNQPYLYVGNFSVFSLSLC